MTPLKDFFLNNFQVIVLTGGACGRSCKVLEASLGEVQSRPECVARAVSYWSCRISHAVLVTCRNGHVNFVDSVHPYSAVDGEFRSNLPVQSKLTKD